jgi:hypothetical protein
MKSINLLGMLCVGLIAAALAHPTIAKPGKAKKAAPVVVKEVWPRDGIQGYVVLSKENGNGEVQRIKAGENIAMLDALLANDVDYIKVVGSQTQVTVFEKPNFTGHSLTLRCGNYELLQQPRNDIESIRVSYVRDDAACRGTKDQPLQFTSWSR